MPIGYRMVARTGQHETVVKKSRFICSLFRVESEEEARAHIDATRKQYWDANHNCTAWAIGEGLRLQRSSDDGEPGGTAGTPMLEVLRRREVTDTLAIVTRYFGGVMLGAGGLISAYGGAVSQALDAVGIVERAPLSIIAVIADYDDAGRIEHALRAREFPLRDVAYGADVTFELAFPLTEVEAFAAWLQELTNGALSPIDLGTQFIEVPVIDDGNHEENHDG